MLKHVKRFLIVDVGGVYLFVYLLEGVSAYVAQASMELTK